MSRRDAVANGAFVTDDGEEFDLVCGANYARERVELLEVDEEILSEILSNDGVIAFKGEPDDVAVVCTRSKTYQVTRVESSNQCLIVGPALGGEEDETEAMEGEEDGTRRATVRAQTSSHLDLTEIAPRLDRLREMMASVAYAGTAEAMDADEGEGEGVGFGFDELNARVQASELEILKCLQEEIVAIEIDGKWRGVDAEYRLHALAMMTASAFGNGVVDERVADGRRRGRDGERRVRAGDGEKHASRVRDEARRRRYVGAGRRSRLPGVGAARAARRRWIEGVASGGNDGPVARKAERVQSRARRGQGRVSLGLGAHRSTRARGRGVRAHAHRERFTEGAGRSIRRALGGETAMDAERARSVLERPGAAGAKHRGAVTEVLSRHAGQPADVLEALIKSGI